MKISFTPEAWDDYLFWQKNNKQQLVRINELIKDMIKTPFEGKGKPEPLRYELKGFWSRRIDHEHRLVYEVSDAEISIILTRFHYSR